MNHMKLCGKDIQIWNKMEFNITASLICGDILNLKEDVLELQKSGVERLHFDVMDGVLVPRYGMYPEILASIKKISDLPIDVHMMVTDAEPYIDVFAKAGADIFNVHVEGNNNLHRTLMKIQKSGMKAGVVLSLATPLNVLDYILEEIDYVMLMGINPGIVGHKIIPKILDKIADLKDKLKGTNIKIIIDGGVNLQSAKSMVEKGADILVCGTSTIYRPQDGSLEQNVKRLRWLVNG